MGPKCVVAGAVWKSVMTTYVARSDGIEPAHGSEFLWLVVVQ